MSIATFDPGHDDSESLLTRRAEGNVLTVSVNPFNRVVLIVDDDDFEKVTRNFDGRITVCDLMTDTYHDLVAADCGAGCRCAIAFA